MEPTVPTRAQSQAARAASTLWLTVGVLMASGCGGAAKSANQAQVVAPAPTAAQVAARACGELGARRAAEIKDGSFHPPDIIYHRIPGDAEDARLRRVAEAEFIALLASGKARTTLVIARGGTGKSKLGWSVEASLCPTLPTARVDLQWDVAEAEGLTIGGDDNALQIIAARRFGAPADAHGGDWLAKHFGEKPWLLLLDALDEVALQRRLMVVETLNQTLDRFPNVRVVVFTRPPVFTGTYGLRTVDALVELPQLDCARTDAAIAEIIPDAERRAAMLNLLRRYGLDRKAQSADGRCYYPHLSTYRDFFVAEKIAQNFAAAGGTAPGNLEPSRTRVYEYYLEVLLIKDLQGTSMAPRAAIALVDRLFAKAFPDDGDRNLSFTLEACLTISPGRDDGEKKAICERLLQSSLFEAAPRGDGRWKLKNQSLYDLFLARNANAEIEATTASPCSAISRRSSLLESNEVAGFLVGMPGGQRCLVSVVHQLCRAAGFSEYTWEQLDQGLPSGPERKRLVEEAAQTAKEALAGHMCVTSTLERLLAGPTRKAPTNTEAPPAPGS